MHLQSRRNVTRQYEILPFGSPILAIGNFSCCGQLLLPVICLLDALPGMAFESPMSPGCRSFDTGLVIEGRCRQIEKGPSIVYCVDV
jgi:hypothetical protein